MGIVEDFQITTELYNNCTATLQNASVTQYELLQQLTDSKNFANILAIIIFLISLIMIFVIIYFIAKKFWSYKLGILKHGQWIYYTRWNLNNKIIIKHDKNDSFTYCLDPEVVYGKTVLWYYHNPNPIIFKGEDNLPRTKDLMNDTLTRSTIIEKFVTAEDFMNIIKIMIIIGIVISIIAVIFSFLSYNKDMVCNLIVDNRTVLTNLIK